MVLEEGDLYSPGRVRVARSNAPCLGIPKHVWKTATWSSVAW